MTSAAGDASDSSEGPKALRGARWADYTFAVAMAVAFLILSQFALGYVERNAPDGHESIGVVADTHLVYMSAIYGSFARESGEGGGLLVHNHQTSEPHPPSQARPWDWAIGKLSVGAGGDPYSAFTLDRYVAVFGFALALTLFLGELVRSRTVRWLALTAAFTGGSFNWILQWAGTDGWWYAHFGDWLGGAMGGLSGLGFAFPVLLLGVPHLMLELVFLSITFAAALRAVRRDSAAWALVSGLSSLMLCSVRPYTLPVALAAVGVVLALHALRGGARGGRRWGMVLLAVTPPLPLVAHYYQVIRGDGIFAGLDVHHPAPLFDEQLFFYGVPVLVAGLFCLPIVWRRRKALKLNDSRVWTLLAVWATVNHLIVFGEAWPKPFEVLWEVEAMLPLPLLALLLASMAADAFSRRRVLMVGVPLLLLHAIPTGFYAAEIAARCDEPFDSLFLAEDEARVLEWLEASVRSSDSQTGGLAVDESPVVLLCDPSTARLVPWRAGVRVYFGHPDHVRDVERKRYRTMNFFGFGTGAAALASEGVTHVLIGPRERRLRDPELDPAQFESAIQGALELVFESGETRLFELRDSSPR